MQVNPGLGDNVGEGDSKEVEAYEPRNLRDMRPEVKHPFLYPYIEVPSIIGSIRWKTASLLVRDDVIVFYLAAYSILDII